MDLGIDIEAGDPHTERDFRPKSDQNYPKI